MQKLFNMTVFIAFFLVIITSLIPDNSFIKIEGEDYTDYLFSFYGVIEEVGGGLEKTYKLLSETVYTVVDTFEDMSSDISNIVSGIKQTINDTIGKTLATIETAVDGISDFMSTTFSGIGNFFNTVIAWLEDIFGVVSDETPTIPPPVIA